MGGDRSRLEREPKAYKGESMEFSWPLSGNALATLTVTRTLEHDDIETLCDYFETAKKALRKAADKAAAEGVQPSA